MVRGDQARWGPGFCGRSALKHASILLLVYDELAFEISRCLLADGLSLLKLAATLAPDAQVATLGRSVRDHGPLRVVDTYGVEHLGVRWVCNLPEARRVCCSIADYADDLSAAIAHLDCILVDGHLVHYLLLLGVLACNLELLPAVLAIY